MAKTLIATDSDDVKLDKTIKKILSNKPILTRIIAEVVDECKGMSFDEIERSIEGPIDIEKIPLDPGLTNMVIEGNTQEDFVPNEGMIVYDIRTYLRVPSNEVVTIKILIDVEAQKDEHPGYDIQTRAVFYCCRMISSKLDKEFTVHTDDPKKYDNIKNVYSIWICPETSQKRANTIAKYSMQKEMLVGKSVDDCRYDLMTAIIINLSKTHNCEDCDNELIRMLTYLFDETKDADEKIDNLKNNYNIPINTELETEVEKMCTYTEKIKTESKEEGIAKGENDLVKAVQMLRSNHTDEEILAYGISQHTLDLAKTIK